MPDRSLKMKRRIFGFQRRVWWPKCTPASSSSRIEATAMCVAPWFELLAPAGPTAHRSQRAAPAPRLIHRVEGCLGSGKCSEGLSQVVRQLGRDVDPRPAEGMVEGEPSRVQE